MALDLHQTKKTAKIKIPSSHLNKKVKSINPWDRPPPPNNKSGDKVATKSEKTNTNPTKKVHKKPLTNLQQTSNKPLTNLQQTSNKPTSQPLTKPLTNLQQTSNKPLTNLQQTSNKPTSQPLTKPLTNLQQTSNKPLTKWGVASLSGLQAKILKFIYDICKKRGSKSSGPVSGSYLATATEMSIRSMQITVIRLIQKKLLIRLNFKNGRGGWSEYEIPQEVYNDLVNLETSNKPLTNLQQTSNKPTSQPTSQPLTNGPSSSNIYNTTTTTSDDKKSQLSGVEIPDILVSSGVGENYLKQVETKFPRALPGLQRSLEALAHDIEKSGGVEAFKKENGIRNFMGWFFGALKNGNYESKHDGFLTDEERGERAAAEWMEKRKREREERREKMEELLFGEWLEERTDEELKEISPSFTGAVRGGMNLPVLRAHFVEEEMEKFKGNFLDNR